ncbi:MAG: DeoR/GlpR family DNA-binding transcription regulator [Paracoccaceae bacterium]
MALSVRQVNILNHLRQNGRARVEELVRLFGKTPQTVRKDLQALADAGQVRRFHGGASLLARTEYVSFEIRREIAPAQKRAIGAAAARRIPDHASLFINVGTTTLEVARSLRRHSGLKVITDNVETANEIRKYPGLEVIIAGGIVRSSDGAIVGEEAVDFIRQFKVDFAVIGAASIDLDGTLLDYDFREAAVVKAIVANARHVILTADSGKVGSSAPIRIGHLSKMDTFVTDICASSAIRQLCSEAGVSLVEAGS